MKKSRNSFWFAVAVLCGLILIVGIAQLNEPKEIIAWQTDFAAARQESELTHKPLFAYFTADWCGPCQSLRSTTWADPNVKLALDGYVRVKIDIDRNQGLAARYAPEAIPTFVVFDRDGEVRKSQVGVLDSDAFLAWLPEEKR